MRMAGRGGRGGARGGQGSGKRREGLTGVHDAGGGEHSSTPMQGARLIQMQGARAIYTHSKNCTAPATPSSKTCPPNL